jgi:transcriptional regulator
MSTIREQIISLLGEEACDARLISQSLSISEKTVYDHLPHIIQSLSAQGKKLKTTPARCISCGFEFKDRKRPNRPSRCPKCKSERIDPPKFRVK